MILDKQQEYLHSYEEKLMQHLLRMLTSMQKLNGKLLESQDITDKWEQMAPSYVADAIKEIADYPTVSLGWAMYLGMAVAHCWDDAWDIYGQMPDLYGYIRDKRGFDYMDEVVRFDILKMPEYEAVAMEKVVQSCSQQALDMIRHEQIDPQSPLAFHVYARSIQVLYMLGAAVELKRMGYKFEMVN